LIGYDVDKNGQLIMDFIKENKMELKLYAHYFIDYRHSNKINKSVTELDWDKFCEYDDKCTNAMITRCSSLHLIKTVVECEATIEIK
jgi:hypothetical protein